MGMYTNPTFSFISFILTYFSYRNNDHLMILIRSSNGIFNMNMKNARTFWVKPNCFKGKYSKSNVFPVKNTLYNTLKIKQSIINI